jgi:hypothetical protein
MRQFPDIERSYNQVNHYLGQQVTLAYRRKDLKQTRKWEQIRDINDNAYFVLLFAQLEEGIKNRLSPVSLSNSSRKSFMGQVRSLTADLAVQNRIQNHYNVRCAIAHGSMVAGLVMISAINDLKNLAQALRI